MSFEFLWRLPVHGDGRAFRKDEWHRGDYARLETSRRVFARTGLGRDGFTYYDHLSQIARAAELTGFDGVFIPQSAAGEEPLVVAGALAREVRSLKLVPSLPAPFLSAVYTAKIGVSFQRLTGGRLAFDFVTEEPTPNAWHGHKWSVAEQIARTDEFLDVVKGFWNNKAFTFHGRYYEVENGGFSDALSGQTLPTIYLSGETEEALALSAKHADVHFLPLEPAAQLRARIADLDARARAHGRALRYGLQADIFARHSDGAAWDYVRRLWEEAAAKTVSISGNPAASLPLKAEAFDALIEGPNLWTGFGHVRPGPAAGLVGGYADVAERIAEYVEAGVSSFAISANPHLEEAYRIGEQLLPQVRARIGALRAA
jgi:alkanesulfonate monooxygenase